MSGTPPATASRDGATPFFTMVNSRLPAPHRAPRLDPAGWEQWLTSVPGRELLAPATGAPNVQIWVFNAVIVIKPASMQNGGAARSDQVRCRSHTVIGLCSAGQCPGAWVLCWQAGWVSADPP
jgi:hypothetical protein